VFFRKRRRSVPPAAGGDGGSGPRPEPESYYIGPDDLLKGNFVPRGRKKVRQFAVLIDARVRIVTTGDVVDRTVYAALVAAGAVVRPPEPTPPVPEVVDPAAEDGPPGDEHGED